MDQDALAGLERYPKAIKSEDTINMQAEIQRLKMQLIQKGWYFMYNTEIKVLPNKVVCYTIWSKKLAFNDIIK